MYQVQSKEKNAPLLEAPSPSKIKKKKPNPKPKYFLATEQTEAKLKVARKHRKAMSFGRRLYPPDPCECCGRNSNVENFPFFVSTSEYAIYGVGYTLYFDFVKFLIILSTTMFSISGLFNLASNIEGHDCVSLAEYKEIQANRTMEAGLNSTELVDLDDVCLKSVISSLSLANKISNVNTRYWQESLDLLAVIAVIFLLQVFVHQSKARIAKLKLRNGPNISDFSLYITKMKQTTVNMKKLREDLATLIEGIAEQIGRPTEVKTISFIFYMQDYLELKANKEEIQKKLFLSVNSGRPFEEVQHWENELDQINSALQSIESQIDFELFNTSQRFVGKAFVTLDNTASAKALESFFSSKQKIFYFDPSKNSFVPRKMELNGTKLEVRSAIHSKNFIWKNVGQGNLEKSIRRSLDVVASLFLFAVTIYSMHKILENQENLQENLHTIFVSVIPKKIDNYLKLTNMLTNLMISLMILAINKFMRWLLVLLSDFERHQKYTAKLSTVMVKIALALFLNSSFFAYLVFSIKHKVVGPTGLIYQIFFNLFLNTIIEFLFISVDIGYIFHFLQRRYYEKQYKKEKEEGQKRTLQSDLSAVFTQPRFQIELYISYKFNFLFMVTFHAMMHPIGYLFYIGFLTIVYFFEKYLLLRCTSFGLRINDELHTSTMRMLDFTLLFMCFGKICDSLNFYGDVSPITAFTTAIVAVYLFLPSTKHNLLSNVYKLPPMRSEKLENHLLKLKEDLYEHQNPATAARLAMKSK